ncbi:30S ribosomal protein S19e [Candidatus Woesearchaeota archaeon]|nr:30S ribosomal protein S19e [Candidatus Woesearchaeota archaeon]
MVTAFDADPQVLIERTAKELKNNSKIQPPEWAKFVKTGSHKEKPPINPDWWHVRAAAVLRSVYIKGPIGVSKLRTKYGGKVYRGKSVKPPHFRKCSGSIIRKILQQLESAGLLEKEDKNIKKGRKVSGNGRKFLDNIAKEIVPVQEKQAQKSTEPEQKPASAPEQEKEKLKEQQKPATEEKNKEKK